MKVSSKTGFLVVIAVICIGVIGTLATIVNTHPSGSPAEKIDWNLTLIGNQGNEKVLTFDELKELSSYEGYGGFFSTVGMKYGPFECKGVSVEDLCMLVGGIEPSDTLWVSAPDGYLMVFTYDQVQGDIITYDPATLREIPHEDLKMILMYEQDGALIPEDDGRPLRIAIVSSNDGFVTEGHYWVKWVNKIEIRTPDR